MNHHKTHRSYRRHPCDRHCHFGVCQLFFVTSFFLILIATFVDVIQCNRRQWLSDVTSSSSSSSSFSSSPSFGSTLSKRGIADNSVSDNDVVPIQESFSHVTQLRGHLPFDREVSIFLFKAETKRFYFQTFLPQANISLTVTPCETPVRWELLFLNSRSIKKLRNRKSRKSRSKKYYLKFLTRKLNDAQLLLNHTSTQRFTYSAQTFQAGLYVVQLTSANGADSTAKVFLSTSSYPYPRIPPVAAVLSRQFFPPPPAVVDNENFDTADDDVFNEIGDNVPDNDDDDNNAQDSAKQSTNASVELWWNPALVSDRQPAFLFEYCVVISEKRHYRDNCLHYKDPNFLEIEPEPDSLPLDDIISVDTGVGDSGGNSGGGVSSSSSSSSSVVSITRSVDNQDNTESMWWNNAARRLLRETIRKEFLEHVIHYQCYNQTRATVHKLKPHINYYADVFVRNLMTGASSRYWTTNFTLVNPVEVKREEAKKKAAMREQRLHDNIYTGVYLDAKNKYRKRFLYKIPVTATSNMVYIYAQPCDGMGVIQLVVRQTIVGGGSDASDRRAKRHHTMVIDDMVFDGRHDEEENDQGVLLFEEVTETRTFEIAIPIADANGTVWLEFEFNTVAHRQSRSLVLLVSSELNKFPFPRLPRITRVQEMESMRKCSSRHNTITLAWYPSPDEKVRYCLHMRDADLQPSFEESHELCDRLNPIKLSSKRQADDGTDDSSGGDSYAIIPTRRVICRRYKSAKHRRNNMIMQEVRRLPPNKRYIFQVVIRKGRERELAYEQVWTETLEQSQCSMKI